MTEAMHNYRGDDHPIAECSVQRCGVSASKMGAIAFAVIHCGGQCPCGRVIGPRCFDGHKVRRCPLS